VHWRYITGNIQYAAQNVKEFTTLSIWKQRQVNSETVIPLQISQAQSGLFGFVSIQFSA
jgi:hypothetical protein